MRKQFKFQEVCKVFLSLTRFVNIAKPTTSMLPNSDTYEIFCDPGLSANKNRLYHQVNGITTIVNDEHHSGVYFVMITRTIYKM